MKLLLCAVHDRAVGAYLPPFAARTPMEATRLFAGLVFAESHPANTHPQDFQLVAIGEFDDNTAAIEAKNEVLMTAEQVFNTVRREIP